MRIITLLVLALTFASCSKSDDDKSSCNCDAQYTYNGNNFTVPDAEIDCETGQPTNPPVIAPGAVFVGCAD